MAEVKLYAVPVREVFDRVAYVRAPSKVEARRLALDPVNWEDADDPMGAGEIRWRAGAVEEETPTPERRVDR